MTLTFELIQDIVKVNACTKFWVRTSNGSAVRELIDAHTHRQTGPILYPRPLTQEGITLYRPKAPIHHIWDSVWDCCLPLKIVVDGQDLGSS